MNQEELTMMSRAILIQGLPPFIPEAISEGSSLEGG